MLNFWPRSAAWSWPGEMLPRTSLRAIRSKPLRDLAVRSRLKSPAELRPEWMLKVAMRMVGRVVERLVVAFNLAAEAGRGGSGVLNHNGGEGGAEHGGVPRKQDARCFMYGF